MKISSQLIRIFFFSSSFLSTVDSHWLKRIVHSVGTCHAIESSPTEQENAKANQLKEQFVFFDERNPTKRKEKKKVETRPLNTKDAQGGISAIGRHDFDGRWDEK